MWAVEARQEAEWDRTAHQLALAINLKAGKIVASAKNFNPYRNSPLKMEPPTLDDMADFLNPE